MKFPWRVTDEQMEELRGEGFADEQIAEAAINVALFLGLATMADVYGLQDSGFHLREIEPDVSTEDDEVIMGDPKSWEEAGTDHQPQLEKPARHEG